MAPSGSNPLKTRNSVTVTLINLRMPIKVEIPVNSSATVYVPATELKNVTESGRDISGAAGVRFLGMEGGCAVFQVQSGIDQFVSSKKGE